MNSRMRILVTGATGFVAGYLVPALLSRFPNTDVIKIGHPDSETLDADILRVDLLDAKAVSAVIASTKPNIIVHLAAQSSVARSILQQDLTWGTNLTGSLHVALGVAEHTPAATLLYASSSEVYGASFIASPVSETSLLMPLSVYGKTKALAERVFADVLPSTASLLIARPVNHTGPGQRESFVLASFVAQVARIEAGLQPPVINTGNLSVSRDFLDVRDVVEAYVALLSARSSLPPRFVCNISSGMAWPLNEILNRLRVLSTTPFEVVVDPERVRSVDLAVAYGDSALIHTAVGWKPKVSMEETLNDMLAMSRADLLKP